MGVEGGRMGSQEIKGGPVGIERGHRRSREDL